VSDPTGSLDALAEALAILQSRGVTLPGGDSISDGLRREVLRIDSDGEPGSPEGELQKLRSLRKSLLDPGGILDTLEKRYGG
jgi:hypothetical protein